MEDGLQQIYKWPLVYFDNATNTQPGYCCENPCEPEYITWKKFAEGLGQTYYLTYSSQGLDEEEQKMVYFKKGNETW